MKGGSARRIQTSQSTTRDKENSRCGVSPITTKVILSFNQQLIKFTFVDLTLEGLRVEYREYIKRKYLNPETCKGGWPLSRVYFHVFGLPSTFPRVEDKNDYSTSLEEVLIDLQWLEDEEVLAATEERKDDFSEFKSQEDELNPSTD